MPSRGKTAARARAARAVRFQRAACSLALLAATATACSPGSTPPPTAPVDTTSDPGSGGPTPSPSFSSPEPPSTDGPLTVAGAEALARYFLELYEYVYSTGDLAEWRRVSHPECVFCAGVVSEVEQQAAAAQRSNGGGFRVDDVTGEQLAEDYVSLRIKAFQAAGTLVDASGEVVTEYLEGPVSLAVAIEGGPGSWSVRGLEVLEEDGA